MTLHNQSCYKLGDEKEEAFLNITESAGSEPMYLALAWTTRNCCHKQSLLGDGTDDLILEALLNKAWNFIFLHLFFLLSSSPLWPQLFVRPQELKPSIYLCHRLCKACYLSQQCIPRNRIVIIRNHLVHVTMTAGRKSFESLGRGRRRKARHSTIAFLKFMFSPIYRSRWKGTFVNYGFFQRRNRITERLFRGRVEFPRFKR